MNQVDGPYKFHEDERYVVEFTRLSTWLASCMNIIRENLQELMFLLYCRIYILLVERKNSQSAFHF